MYVDFIFLKNENEFLQKKINRLQREIHRSQVEINRSQNRQKREFEKEGKYIPRSNRKHSDKDGQASRTCDN